MYRICCGRFLDGGVLPATALELMRSRYSAYALGNERYLQTTWYGSSRPAERLLTDGEQIKWLSLEVRRHEEQGSDATVEFVARYKVQGRAHKLHEISRFIREEGRWFYLDGRFPTE